MLINYRNEMLHDSSQDLFRDPVGAVTAGSQVKLRFRARLENVNSVYLCLFRREFREQHLMKHADEYWEVDITGIILRSISVVRSAITVPKAVAPEALVVSTAPIRPHIS